MPDWLTWVSVIATAFAAMFAAGTILQSRNEARRAEQTLLRVRRADFQLGLLKELADGAATWQQAQYRDAQLAIRARMLPMTLIPLSRAALRLETTDAAEAQFQAKLKTAQYSGSYWDMMRDEVQRELLDAVDATLASR